MRAVSLIALAGLAFTVQGQTKLKVGDTAPDFSLPSTTGKDIKLSDFRGKQNVVLAFFVHAFTGG
jgi:peroxiredoxin